MKKILWLLLLPLSLYAEVGYIEPWGKDAHLKVEYPEAATPPKKLSPLSLFAEQMILFHHNVLTHIDGARSHFRPSSSTYMLEAIRSYGFFKGYIMGCDRLLRENSDPWLYRTKLIDNALFKWDSPTEREGTSL